MILAQRILTVTQGNLNNHHLYLTEVMDLFPLDTIGGENRTRAARPVRVRVGTQEIETDIVRDKHIFRRRRWVGTFFADQRVQAGDRLVLEQLEPYLYRLTPMPRVEVADATKNATAPGFPCMTCDQHTTGPGQPIFSLGLGGRDWLTRPVRLCGGCYSLLGLAPAVGERRCRQNAVEAAVSFWFRCAVAT